jgi:hypothetical protein
VNEFGHISRVSDFEPGIVGREAPSTLTALSALNALNALSTLNALGALSTSVTLFAPVALFAMEVLLVIADRTFVAFLEPKVIGTEPVVAGLSAFSAFTPFTRFALFALLTFFTFLTDGTVFSVETRSAGFPVFAIEAGGTVFPVFTVQTSSALFAALASCTLFAFERVDEVSHGACVSFFKPEIVGA